MIYANLKEHQVRGNRPFMPGAGTNGGEFFIPFRMLRERFAERGVEINTPDMNAGRTVSFELHVNAQYFLPRGRPCYVYLYEDPLIRPINADLAQIGRYRKVFTSNETLINGQNVHRLDYPNDLALHEFQPWGARDLFCVMIATNRALRRPSPRNLHEQRVQTIRYFEAHAPEDFALFGSGWNIPAVLPGVWGRIVKIVHRLREKIGGAPPAFPSYRGRFPGPKRDVLARARFCICYENVRGSPGYLTEKIFDCLASGCVPVYMGAVDALTPIPDECYIDGDRFASPRDMHAFLKTVTEAQFAGYQDAMREFLASPQSRRFSNEHFCSTLVTTILDDLASAK